jgi:hypothetical protein
MSDYNRIPHDFTPGSKTITIYGDVGAVNIQDFGATAVDISDMPTLLHLDCAGNDLGTLDVSGSTGLRYLDCSNCNLTEMNIDGCLALRVLNCYRNRLTGLDLSDREQLTALDCSFNPLGEIVSGQGLDLGGAHYLRILQCVNNGLDQLDLNGNNGLEILVCGNTWAGSPEWENMENDLRDLPFHHFGGSLYLADFSGNNNMYLFSFSSPLDEMPLPEYAIVAKRQLVGFYWPKPDPEHPEYNVPEPPAGWIVWDEEGDPLHQPIFKSEYESALNGPGYDGNYGGGWPVPALYDRLWYMY